MTTRTSYFLLSYRLDDHSVAIEDFGSDIDAATAAYTQREHEHRDAGTVEVVLVGADSLDTVRKTHSHYFAQDDDLLHGIERDLLALHPGR